MVLLLSLCGVCAMSSATAIIRSGTVQVLPFGDRFLPFGDTTRRSDRGRWAARRPAGSFAVLRRIGIAGLRSEARLARSTRGVVWNQR